MIIHGNPIFGSAEVPETRNNAKGKHMRILCTGDLHLGRSSSKVLTTRDGQHSCENAWDRIVDLAEREHVNVLVLSGDIVDENAAYFETLGPLERGMRRLSECKIATYVIAGNHDYEVLPKLERDLQEFDLHLLGAGGEWQQTLHSNNGEPVLHLVGWSFADRYVDNNPMQSFPSLASNGVPVLGILHATLDSASCRYAPVPTSDLRQRGVDVWVVGHVHAPVDCRDRDCPVLNVGSPQAMDPGETGVHGPWIIETDGRSVTSITQVPLSSVCYCRESADVTEVRAESEFKDCLEKAVDDIIATYPEFGDPPVFSCRITLSGRSSLLREIEVWAEKVVKSQPWSGEGVFIDEIPLDISPDYDVRALAESGDAVGIAAGILAAIEDGKLEQDYPGLLESVKSEIGEVFGSRHYKLLNTDDRPTPECYIRTECRRLIDTLLRQKGEVSNA